MRLRLAALPAAAVAAAALGSAAPASAAGDPIMPLSQVQSGMRCTGYSVVHGTAISSFDVEVLDVVDGDPSEDGPRILVQVSGPAVDATGIGPGFSGSPIYCPDAAGAPRNIGAISESIGEYGGKTVLATPIEAILSARPNAPRGKAKAKRAARGVSARAARVERRMRREGVKPLTGPLTISGVNAPLGRALEAAGRRAGRPVLATPAGPLGSFPRQQLRPGSAVAVGYSSGDLRLGAIGTVAYTDGNAVWAFGHPFEAAGARSLFLQDAYVFRVVDDPSGASGGSYKLSAPGHDLGTLTNDALDAVVGRVGKLPRSIPIAVRARDDDTGRVEHVHVDAASETEVDDPTGFSPLGQVAPVAVLQGGTDVLGAAPGRLSGRMCVTITLRELHTPAHFCNRYSSSVAEGDGTANGVALAAAGDLSEALGLLDAYAGRPPHVERVEVSLHERRGERLADLLRVRAPKTVRPGARIPLRVTLQPVRSARIARTYRVRLPKHLETGRHALSLTGRDASAGSGLGGLIDIVVGGPEPRPPATLRQLVAAIDAVGGYDGVTGRLAGRGFRAFRDAHLLVTGRAKTTVRVRRAR